MPPAGLAAEVINSFADNCLDVPVDVLWDAKAARSETARAAFLAGGYGRRLARSAAMGRTGRGFIAPAF
jgi:hypothetical protein